MNANELADDLQDAYCEGEKLTEVADFIRKQQEQIDKLTAIVALRELKIEHMIEKQSHYEAMAHAGGVEAGKELAVKEVMSEHCTCYKLGYNPLNNYRKVESK